MNGGFAQESPAKVGTNFQRFQFSIFSLSIQRKMAYIPLASDLVNGNSKGRTEQSHALRYESDYESLNIIVKYSTCIY